MLDSVRSLERILVFPDPDYGPSARPKPTVSVLIPRDVAIQLRPPPCLVRLRRRRMDRATMPEAAVNEDGYAPARERNIAPSASETRQGKGVVHAVPQAASMELDPQSQLRQCASPRLLGHASADALAAGHWLNHVTIMPGRRAGSSTHRATRDRCRQVRAWLVQTSSGRLRSMQRR
jgi:hypothetical protein